MQIRSVVPRPGAVARAGVEVSRAAQQRLRWMSYYRRHRHVARTCRYFGISRETFYRWKRRWDPQDLTQLEDRSHRPHQVRRPSWSSELVERVLHYRQRFPRWGKDKLVVLLRRERRAVSTSMVGRILVSEGTRPITRATPARRSLRSSTTPAAPPSMGRTQAPTLAHRTSRRSGAGRYQTGAPSPRGALASLQRPRHG